MQDTSQRTPAELSRLAYEASIAGSPDAADLARAASIAYQAARA